MFDRLYNTSMLVGIDASTLQMVAAGLPKAFADKCERAVAEAIENYGG